MEKGKYQHEELKMIEESPHKFDRLAEQVLQTLLDEGVTDGSEMMGFLAWLLVGLVNEGCADPDEMKQTITGYILGGQEYAIYKAKEFDRKENAKSYS